MNKKGISKLIIWSVVGLIIVLLAGGAYLLVHSTSSPGKIAVIVPAVNVTPGIPQVIFIGVTTVPLDLATNQGVINNVVITFSEAMDPSTVNQNTFLVKGPNNAVISGAITSDSTKKIWTFNPTNSLGFNTVYNITVTTGAKGVSGNALIKDFIWSFTTSYGYSGNGGSGGGSTTTECNSNSDCSGSKVCQSNICVSPPSTTNASVLTAITLSPISKTLNVANTTQLTATGKDQNGTTMAATILYITSNASVAKVNASGFITALVAGNTTITATSGSIINKSIITVVSVGAGCPAVSPVNLGLAANYVILAGTAITNTGTTAITGNLGISPGAASDTTGFGWVLDSTGTFATSDPTSLVTGKFYASDYTSPTPTNVGTAVGNMATAFTNADGLAFCVTELGAGNIGGLTLASGVYYWSSDVIIPTDLTLSGNSTDVWVFQIAQTLDISSATQVNLIGGAQAKNIFWIVTGTTTLETTSTFKGNIISGPGTSTIALETGATLNGRALGQTDVTLDASTIR